MHDAAFRAVVFDAARGLDALNAFIETRLALADDLEANGSPEAAQEVREVWYNVWATLADAPRRALMAELHDIMEPIPPDSLVECDDEAFETVDHG